MSPSGPGRARRLPAEGQPQAPRHARLQPAPAAARRGGLSPRQVTPQATPRPGAAGCPAPRAAPGPPHASPTPGSRPRGRSPEPPPPSPSAGGGPASPGGSGKRVLVRARRGTTTATALPESQRPPPSRRRGRKARARPSTRRGGGGGGGDEARRFGTRRHKPCPGMSRGRLCEARFLLRGLCLPRKDKVKASVLASVPSAPPEGRSVGAARWGHRIPGAGGRGSAASALVRQRREFPARPARGDGRGGAGPRPGAVLAVRGGVRRSFSPRRSFPPEVPAALGAARRETPAFPRAYV